jgi:hypothetical protein
MCIHHWVLLQFLHPAFEVPSDLREFYVRGRFKHPNWADFIHIIDADFHNDNQKHGLEWLRTRVTQRGNN